MKHLNQFGSPNYPALKQATKVKELISDLDRLVRILESDIATEEEHACEWDSRSASYPALARMLSARRDNLKETVAALKRRLPLS